MQTIGDGVILKGEEKKGFGFWLSGQIKVQRMEQRARTVEMKLLLGVGKC